MAHKTHHAKLNDSVACRREEPMRLFSYVVARDYGFAPNPFFGLCTLATCKPVIRKTASVGDWIIGTGSSRRNRRGYLVYVMRVSEAMTFNEYWNNEQCKQKKPDLRGSKKQAFGDNIYFKDTRNQWQQKDSHHSYANGSPNPHNIGNDTKADRILFGNNYAYWGGSGPEIPIRFRNWNGLDICAHRGHKSNFPDDLVADFVGWFQSLDVNGFLGAPADWPKSP